MLTLYEFGNSVCCQKVRYVLSEKGLTWEPRQIDLMSQQQYDPEYLRVNPKGLVPTLVHDGRSVIESTLICEYLDEVFPEPRLVPESALARAHMRLWSKAVDEGLHEGVTEISFSAMFRERLKNAPESQRQIRFRNVGDPRRRDRFMSTYELGVESPFVLWAIAAYERAFKTMEATLAEGGEWLVGDAFSLADVNLIPYVARLEYLTLLDVWIGNRPRVRAWWERAKARAAFAAAIADPLTQKERDDMRTFGGKIRRRVQELHAGLPAFTA
jgi:ganglioside-induced differentiation-associated protein 1